MICKQCSSAIVDSAQFCPVCGMKQHPGAQPAPQPAYEQDEDLTVVAPRYQQPAVQQDVYEQDEDQTVGPSFHRPVPVRQSAPAQSFDEPSTRPMVDHQPVPPVAEPQPIYTAPVQQPQAAPAPSGKVTFGQAIKLFFQNFFNFQGRATKSEYWWTFLFICLVNLGLMILAAVIPVLPSLASLLLSVGSIAIAIRRLHDTGKPFGWWFMGWIPLAGPIILLIFLLKDSDGDNQWGPRR